MGGMVILLEGGWGQMLNEKRGKHGQTTFMARFSFVAKPSIRNNVPGMPSQGMPIGTALFV
jgi:hypothetical protein